MTDRDLKFLIERVRNNAESWRAKAEAEQRRPVTDDQYEFWFGEPRKARVDFLLHCAESAEMAAATLTAAR